MKDLVQDFGESAWFMLYDAVCYILDKVWTLFVAVLCMPIAVLGLVFDKLRAWVKMVRQYFILSLRVVP